MRLYEVYRFCSASSFAIFGALYPSCPRLNSLLFVLTVRSHSTCDRSINSPLPKQDKHIITCLHHSNISAKRSTKRNYPNFEGSTPQLCTNFASTLYVRTVLWLCIQTMYILHNFVRTSPQLCMKFVSTLYKLHLNFVRTTPQLPTNFASTSFELCPNFRWSPRRMNFAWIHKVPSNTCCTLAKIYTCLDVSVANCYLHQWMIKKALYTVYIVWDYSWWLRLWIRLI